MFVKFKKITFKNLLSFGATPTTIDFKKGIYLISGLNGKGKSSILDALSYCLYGQPYRDIKIKDLVNRKNKKNLLVTCEFSVDDSDDYIISRGLSPDRLDIIKNNQNLNLLSSKKLNQNEIDKIIGINHQLFKQVISLAVNYNKPFLSLLTPAKRDVVENIFNIKVFSVMLKSIKKLITEIKPKKEMNEQKINHLKETILNLRTRTNELTNIKNNFESTKKQDLEITNNKIQTLKQLKEQNETLINNIKLQIANNKYNKKQIDELTTQKEQIIKIINEAEYRIKINKNKITLLEKNNKCPECNSDITSEHKTKELTELNNQIEKDNNLIQTNKNNKTAIENKIIEQKNYEKELTELNIKTITTNEKINYANKEINNLLENINKIQEKKIDFDILPILDDIENKKKEYKLIWDSNVLLSKTLKNNETVQTILLDNGIKSFFFKKLVPILNEKINDYVKFFELPVNIQFDDLMNEKISSLDSYNSNISYFSYSEGEKKRIDVAILLSFIDIMKAISGWNSNLLIIDELLDGAIDEQGLDKMVTCLKNITDIFGISTYIISHKLQQDQLTEFNGFIYIDKDAEEFSKVNFKGK